MATTAQIEKALRNAHKAGDTAAARKLARALKESRQTPRETWEEMKGSGPLQRATRRSEQALAGTGRGMLDVAEGIKQLGLDVGEKTGIVEPGSSEEFTREAQKEREFYEQTPAGQSAAGMAGRFAGQAAPAAVVPGGVAGGIANRMATGALAGGGIGLAQFVPEGGNRLAQAATGAAFGGAIPALFGIGRMGLEKAKTLLGKQTPEMAEEFIGETIEPQARKAMRAARGLDKDFRLTPAEASGDPILAAAQGRMGRSDEGARELLGAATKRQAKEKQVIDAFFDDIASDSASAAPRVRRAAKEVLGEQKAALQKAARPLYKSAYKESVDDGTFREIMDDPVISGAFEKVQKKPIFQRELQDAAPTSIKTLDQVKRELDDQIEEAVRQGRNNQARILRGAKEDLVSRLDEVSPDYAAARATFSEGARPLQELEESTIGKVANLSDQQLKRASQTIFDRQEVDPKTMDKIRKVFVKKDPEAWRRLMRNEMERRLDAVKGERTGSTFYNQILSKDRDFKMFMRASKDMPEVRKKLLYMRRTFKDLISPESVKGAAGKAKSSLDVPRSTMEAVSDWVMNLMGGRYDKAAVDLITNPRWDDEFQKIMRAKSKARQYRELDALFGKAAAAQQNQ